jgi:hypothetical protein
MHSYTKHLLEDISKAYRPQDFFKKEPVTSEDPLEAKLRESETFLDYDSNPSFGTFCGLKSESFPIGEKIEKEDLIELTQALIKMFESWNIVVVLPDDLPVEMGYRMTLNLIGEPLPIKEFGYFYMDFCSGSPEECKFEGYCSCLKQVDTLNI